MSITSHFDDLPSVSPLQAASRFDPYFDVYGLGLKQQADLDSRTVTLIARSPASPPAQALAINLGRFQPLSLEVRIIFAQIAPANALNFIGQALNASCRQAPETIIRWAKNRALLDAHERLTLGKTLCWTGNSMRRPEDSRSAMDRVDDERRLSSPRPMPVSRRSGAFRTRYRGQRSRGQRRHVNSWNSGAGAGSGA